MGGRLSVTFDFALVMDASHVLAKEAGDMRRVAGRALTVDDRARLGDAVRGGEHRGAAEAVANQDRRRGQRFPQMIRGGDEIVHIGGERRVGELALAHAEPGEIETQHGNAVELQPLRDPPRRLVRPCRR